MYLSVYLYLYLYKYICRLVAFVKLARPCHGVVRAAAARAEVVRDRARVFVVC